MKKINLLIVLMMLLTMFNLNPVQAAGEATVVTVSPANLNGWGVYQENPVLGTGDFVPGPQSAPMGSGSARLVVDSTARTNWIAGLLAGTHFSEITRLEYSTYVVQGGPPQAIVFQINVDYTGLDNPDWQGRLAYEPYMSGTVVQGIWQTWDMQAVTGKWWGSKVPTFAPGLPPSGHTCAQSDPCTWAQLKQNWSNLRVHPNPLLGAVMLRAGGPWSGFVGMADNLTIGVNGVDTTYDFEPASTVYVNNTWGAVAFGIDPDGDGPAHAMGLDAFTTIQAGVDHVADNGTVEVTAGTYIEQVKITRALTLNGAGIDQTVVQSPVFEYHNLVTRTNVARTYDYVIGAFDASGVTIQNLSVNGNKEGKPYSTSITGIRAAGVVLADTDGTVQNVHIYDVQMPDAFGSQTGPWMGLEASNVTASGKRIVTIKNVTVERFQKTAISIRSDAQDGMQATIDGNIVLTNTETRTAQNGIQMVGGRGDVTNNVVSGVYYDGVTWNATSIFLYNVGAVRVQGNRVENGDYGIYLLGGPATITGNTILGGQSKLNLLNSDSTLGIEVDAGNFSSDMGLAITGNNISGWDTGINIEQCSGTCGAGQYDPVTLHFNRIAGNSFGLVNRSTSAVDAINNWWGCNAGPNDEAGDCDTFSPENLVTVDPWLVLRLNADSTHVLPKTPSNLTASLTYNSAGDNTASLGLLPLGGNLAFTATKGILSAASMPLSSSAAQTALSVTPGDWLSKTTVSVVYDAQTLSIDLDYGLTYIYLPGIYKK